MSFTFLSLGCKAIFLLGGKLREDPPIAMFLRSGDVVLMAGEARECFHGKCESSPIFYFRVLSCDKQCGFPFTTTLNCGCDFVEYCIYSLIRQCLGFLVLQACLGYSLRENMLKLCLLRSSSPTRRMFVFQSTSKLQESTSTSDKYSEFLIFFVIDIFVSMEMNFWRWRIVRDGATQRRGRAI